jgi:hypothetical protein
MLLGCVIRTGQQCWSGRVTFEPEILTVLGDRLYSVAPFNRAEISENIELLLCMGGTDGSDIAAIHRISISAPPERRQGGFKMLLTMCKTTFTPSAIDIPLG